MNNRIRWLHLSYWTGAVIDALAALQMLIPALFAITNNLPNFQPDPAYTYAMGMGASLMLGWTVLLIWADRKPVERKAVLLITIVPVLAGLVLNELWAVGQSRFLAASAVAPVWFLQTVLVALFAFSYLKARGIESERPPQP